VLSSGAERCGGWSGAVRRISVGIRKGFFALWTDLDLGGRGLHKKPTDRDRSGSGAQRISAVQIGQRLSKHRCRGKALLGAAMMRRTLMVTKAPTLSGRQRMVETWAWALELDELGTKAFDALELNPQDFMFGEIWTGRPSSSTARLSNGASYGALVVIQCDTARKHADSARAKKTLYRPGRMSERRTQMLINCEHPVDGAGVRADHTGGANGRV
jgi:hypothetical protein